MLKFIYFPSLRSIHGRY